MVDAVLNKTMLGCGWNGKNFIKIEEGGVAVKNWQQGKY
jgi:hypothetical protein